MAAWTRPFVLAAQAKLNLGLQIGAIQPNGLHEIRSFVASLALADRLTFRPYHGPFRVICDGLNVPEQQNLAFRAAAALACDADGVEIRIEKCIPVQAGLGGGSADAAAALAGLARIAHERGATAISHADLIQAAASLGSDVPACLVNGFKRISGTGEIVRADPVQVPEWGVVLLKPVAGMPTANAYRLYDEWVTESRRGSDPLQARDRSDEIATCIQSGRFTEFCEQIHNDFDPIVRRVEPAVGQAHERLRAAGAEGSLLCGSGTAVAGFFRSVQDAKGSADTFELKTGEWVFATGFTSAD